MRHIVAIDSSPHGFVGGIPLARRGQAARCGTDVLVTLDPFELPDPDLESHKVLRGLGRDGSDEMFSVRVSFCTAAASACSPAATFSMACLACSSKSMAPSSDLGDAHLPRRGHGMRLRYHQHTLPKLWSRRLLTHSGGGPATPRSASRLQAPARHRRPRGIPRFSGGRVLGRRVPGPGPRVAPSRPDSGDPAVEGSAERRDLDPAVAPTVTEVFDSQANG